MSYTISKFSKVLNSEDIKINHQTSTAAKLNDFLVQYGFTRKTIQRGVWDGRKEIDKTNYAIEAGFEALIEEKKYEVNFEVMSTTVKVTFPDGFMYFIDTLRRLNSADNQDKYTLHYLADEFNTSKYYLTDTLIAKGILVEHAGVGDHFYYKYFTFTDEYKDKGYGAVMTDCRSLLWFTDAGKKLAYLNFIESLRGA